MTDASGPAATAESATKKSAGLNIALFAVGLALLAFSIWSNRDQIQKSLTGQLRYGLMLQAFALHSFGVLIAFFRWFGLVRLLGIRIPLADRLVGDRLAAPTPDRQAVPTPPPSPPRTTLSNTVFVPLF